MKLVYKFGLVPALLLSLLIPASSLRAQGKPAAIISINSVDEWLLDVGFVSTLAGQPLPKQALEQQLGGFVQGLDRSRPIGATVTFTQGPIPNVLAFVPVKNLQQLLGSLARVGVQAQDGGNGVKVINAGFFQIYIKEQGGWAFVGQSPAAFNNLPKDPLKLLGGLNKKYDFAIKGNLQEVPQAMRQALVQQVEQGASLGLRQQPGESQESYELRKTVTKMQIKQMKDLLESTDSMTIGLSIDRKVKEVFLDMVFTGIPGSELARQAANFKSTKSQFAGFLMDGAAVTVNFASKVGQADVAQFEQMVQMAKQNAVREIDNDGSISDDVKKEVKSILDEVIEVAYATLKQGKVDAGAVVVLDNKSVQFAAGGLLADGKKLESAFKKLVKLAEQEPDFPKVKMNASSYKGIDFHSITVPVPDPEAARFLGESLEVVVGMGKTSAYVAFGKDCTSLVKKVIDSSASKANDTVPPLQMNVALGPILDFASSFDDNQVLQALAVMLKQSNNKDHVSIVGRGVPNGQAIKIVVESDIIKAIGAAATGR